MNRNPATWPWRVEALEQHSGTGTHVTFHATIDDAISQAWKRLAESGICSVVLRRYP